MAYSLQPGDTLHGSAGPRSRIRQRVVVRIVLGSVHYMLDGYPARIDKTVIERWLSGEFGSTVRHVPKGLGLPDGI